MVNATLEHIDLSLPITNTDQKILLNEVLNKINIIQTQYTEIAPIVNKLVDVTFQDNGLTKQISNYTNKAFNWCKTKLSNYKHNEFKVSDERLIALDKQLSNNLVAYLNLIQRKIDDELNKNNSTIKTRTALTVLSTILIIPALLQILIGGFESYVLNLSGNKKLNAINKFSNELGNILKIMNKLNSTYLSIQLQRSVDKELEEFSNSLVLNNSRNKYNLILDKINNIKIIYYHKASMQDINSVFIKQINKIELLINKVFKINEEAQTEIRYKAFETKVSELLQNKIQSKLIIEDNKKLISRDSAVNKSFNNITDIKESYRNKVIERVNSLSVDF